MRAETAYKARTVGELADVLRDLPSGRAAVTMRERRSAWHLPAGGTVGAADATVVVAIMDGGVRGAFDGVAAVPFWATLACGGLLAVRLRSARLRASVPRRAEKAT